MSELDLSQPLTPPDGGEHDAVVLAAPAAVPEVQPEQAVGLVAVPADKRSELAKRGQEFVASLAGEQPQSPAFAKKVDDLVRMGAEEIRASAQVSNRMLERPQLPRRRAGPRAGGRSAGSRRPDPAGPPHDHHRPGSGSCRSHGRPQAARDDPRRKKLAHYFQRYQSAQTQLNAIIDALTSGQDELRRDNAAIEQERANLWATMGRLAEYTTLATALDDALSEKIAQVRTTDPRAADVLTSDALFPIRQRRQDLVTQIAVSVQGYLALDMIRKNNLELIKGVERAQTTTVSALRTAVVVAQALGNQRLVLDQINALNDATSSMIGRTSELLKQQSAGVQEQSSSSGISVETLQHAFDDVFATMDAIDTYKAKAVENMAQTVSALEAQVARSQQYLERSHASEHPGGASG